MIKRVLVATGFNLLFEYSLRGVNDLAGHPALLVFLFLLYFPYFLLLDEWVRRRRAAAMSVAAAGFAFGSFSALFLPGSMFDPARPLGINWSAFWFVNIVWWATLQGVLTLYLAVRLVPRRVDESCLKPWQSGLILVWLVGMLLVFRAGIKAPSVIRPPAGACVLVLGAAALGLAWWLSRARAEAGARALSEPPPAGHSDGATKRSEDGAPVPETTAQPSRFLDSLLIATVLVFLFCMLVLIRDPAQVSIHRVNVTALRVVIGWTTLLFLATCFHAVITRRPIPV